MAKNRYGVDKDYFLKKIQSELVNNMDSLKPDELARILMRLSGILMRLSVVTDKNVMLESEFIGSHIGRQEKGKACEYEAPKFRGKSVKTGEWVYGFYVEIKGAKVIVDESTGESYLVRNESVGMGSGIFIGDDGKEIFEGDYLDGFEFPVSFEEGCFWVGIRYDYHRFELKDFEVGIKVIGNVVDNPELEYKG